MIDRLKTLVVSGALLAALAVVPTDVAAQSDFDLTINGGIVMPMSDLADGWDLGSGFGAGATFWLNEKFGVQLSSNVESLIGKEMAGDAMPDLTQFHMGGGISFALTDRASGPYGFVANIGGGYTYMRSDGLSGSTTSPNFGEWYPSVAGSVEFGYDLAEDVSIGLTGGIRMTLADEADTDFFPEFRPGFVDAFSSGMTIPVGAVIRIKF